jgi:V/A-type H+-transporting ATPase subunit D
MALLDVPATKSALLALRRQLAFAEEGYALLDQKRELLLLELTARRARAAAARAEAEALLARARAALKEATLDSGGAALDRAALGAPRGDGPEIKEKRLMGVRLPDCAAAAAAFGAVFGPGEVTAAGEEARRCFLRALGPLAALAGLETSEARLALELKKTQRRCNALSKKMIPDTRETITFLGGSLEEREREAFVILRMIRDRLRLEEDAD